MPGPATQLFQVFFFRGISLLALSQCVSSKDKKETPPVNKKKGTAYKRYAPRGELKMFLPSFFSTLRRET